MSLNTYLQELVGQKITGVVAMQGQGRPAFKVQLVLDNGSYFEFYGQDIENAKGCWPGGKEEVRRTEQGYYKIVEEFWEG